MFQYFCLNENEADRLIISLESINNLKVLEKSIDRDFRVINKHWINIWQEWMAEIRLYCIEIIQHLTYMKLDSLTTSKNIKFEEFFKSKYAI